MSNSKKRRKHLRSRLLGRRSRVRTGRYSTRGPGRTAHGRRTTGE